MNKVLIVDDDKHIRKMLCELLELNGFSYTEASCGMDAIGIFRDNRPDAVLIDLRMPGMDGIETMKELMLIDRDIPVIFVTGMSDIDTAIETIKLGAYDFIIKPPKIDRLIFTLKRAVDKLEMTRSLKKLDSAVEASLEWMLGKSTVIKKITKQINQVASSDLSIVIQGETGTGKTHTAQIIHNLSKRANGPFMTVDIGAIPDTLIESELFGHEKGAFTGADVKKKGYFESARGGTLFIDDLQNVSYHLQSKLLRAVEEKKIYPVGSVQPMEIDVRIIAATNMDIREAVASGKFREDLYYRIGEFIINLPPLRERPEDIPFFAGRFLKEIASDMDKHITGIEYSALDRLIRHSWSGNIRELRNVIRRAVLWADSELIQYDNIEFLMDRQPGPVNPSPLRPLKEVSLSAVKDVEEKAIKQALKHTNGNKSQAAAILQVDYKTLLTKMKNYGI